MKQFFFYEFSFIYNLITFSSGGERIMREVWIT